MTNEEIIQGLQFTIDMFLSDPLTGEPITKPRNDMDKTTIDACKGAIELLEQQPCEDKIIEWKKDFKEYVNSLSMLNDDYKGIMEYIDELPVTSELCEDAISREQVINAVADLFEMSEYPHPYPQGKPIRLKDIKEKLKQLPSVQPKPIECEDAISRQAAIDEIKSHYRVDNDLLEVIAYKISKLPSVQPKIKTGHWIVHPKGIYAHLVCDKCLSNAPYDCRTNYCPNCGAKMQEVEDGNK